MRYRSFSPNVPSVNALCYVDTRQNAILCEYLLVASENTEWFHIPKCYI